MTLFTVPSSPIMGSPIRSRQATKSGAAPNLSSFLLLAGQPGRPIDLLSLPHPTPYIFSTATLYSSLLVPDFSDAISKTRNHVNQAQQIEQTRQDNGPRLRYLQPAGGRTM